jgi:hypothetical protein
VRNAASRRIHHHRNAADICEHLYVRDLSPPPKLFADLPVSHRAGFILDSLTFISYAIPGVVVALALIFVYLQPPLRPLGIYESIWIIVLGLVTQYLQTS